MSTTARSWSSSKDSQNWHGEISPYSQQGQASQQRQSFQPSAQQPARYAAVQTMPHTTSYTVSKQSTRQSTPNSTHSSYPASGASTNGDSQSMVLHSLQIPTRISKTGGNLADFSAQVRSAYLHTLT